jgi:hypothetical protein
MLILISLFNIEITAQQINKDSTSTEDILLNDGRAIVDDAVSYFISPLNFNLSEWMKFAAISAGTVMLITRDEAIRKSIGRNTIKSLNNDLWDVPTKYGIITYANIFSGAVYLIGLTAEDNEIRITGRLMFESLTYSGLTVMAVRYLAGRVRPYYEKGAWEFLGFQTDNEFQSFPSGHTVVAFSLSTILAERIDTWWSRIFFYGLAGMTSYARVINNQHFASDVFSGAMLGLFSGLFVISKEKEREYSLSVSGSESESGFYIFPGINKINLLYSF